MQKKTLTAMTAVGLAAAIAIPTMAFGNARRNLGSLANERAVSTPFVARLVGANELTAATPTGDPDGIGAAAVTFDLTAGAETVCWDLSYSNLDGIPILAHIHQGAAGVAGPVVIGFTPFTTLTATGATSCRALVGAEIAAAAAVVANPAGFYVNVHTVLFPAGAERGQLGVGAAPAGEAHFLPVALRAYDSREHGAKIVNGENRTISLATGKDIAGTVLQAVPPGATAAIVTLTVTETTVSAAGGNGGFLKMYNATSAVPATSSINWAGVDQNVAVSVQVSVDAADQVIVTAGANSTHFVIDVVGYLF